MEWQIPWAGLGLGGLLGYSTGYLLKKFLKIGLVILALGFLMIQALSRAGWVQVDWGLIEMAFEEATGERGVITQGQSLLWQGITANLPFAAGFGLAAVLGWRQG